MENIVSHHRTTLGVSFLSSALSRRGMNEGSPQEESRGKGKLGSISLSDERGEPPINLWRATVKALRYLTTNTGPWCFVKRSNMSPNLVRIWSRDGTLVPGNRIRVKTLPYLRSTTLNSCELRSDTIYVFSWVACSKDFRSLLLLFIEVYIVLFLLRGMRYSRPTVTPNLLTQKC